MSDFADKMHDLDGATVSFPSLEIDQTKKECVQLPEIDPGSTAWQAWMLPQSYLILFDLNNKISWIIGLGKF